MQVEIKDLMKKYGNQEVYAVANLSIKINSGEIYGFVGPNGAGKSTTIKCLVGILPFSSGDILADGISIKTDPLKVKSMIGYVSDNHAVFEQLTGYEYVNHIANLYKVSKEDREERCQRLLKIFQMEESFNAPIKSYSHGMKQKIMVIASLIHEPKLWVLDEPLTGLDPQSAYQLKKVMREHADKGNIVFFSSHILDVVENLCNRCGIIEHGSLKGEFNLKELKKNNESLENIFMHELNNYSEGE